LPSGHLVDDVFEGLDLQPEVLLVYGGLWWFMVVYGGLWWFMVVYGRLVGLEVYESSGEIQERRREGELKRGVEGWSEVEETVIARHVLWHVGDI
jgi:hypothetical protein